MEANYVFSPNCNVLRKDQKIVFTNSENGLWFSISKQCYEILDMFIGKSLPISALYSALIDEEDRTFFSQLIDKLEKEKYIYAENGSDLPDNEIDTFTLLTTERCNLCCTHCCADAKDAKKRMR